MDVEKVSPHLEQEHGEGQRQANPEAAGHVPQLGPFAALCRRQYRLQRHAADGAVARAHLAHLRVHRAGVLDVLAAGAHAWICVFVMPMDVPIGMWRVMPHRKARLDVGRSRCRRINRYAAGSTNIDSSGAVIIPPTIGAAMRCITSEPVPVPHMIGNRPARMTATVIAFGRTRSTAPSRIASSRSAVLVLPSSRRARQACFRYSSMST